jgi:NADPH:quinone reductase-like Zn-dependent oxidoreductase
MRSAGTREEEAPLAQIVEAHRYMKSNQQIGKIVVTV